MVANDATSYIPRYTWKSGTDRILRETARDVRPPPSPPPPPSLSSSLSLPSPSLSTSCLRKTMSGTSSSPSSLLFPLPPLLLLADLQSLTKPGAMYLFFFYIF